MAAHDILISKYIWLESIQEYTAGTLESPSNASLAVKALKHKPSSQLDAISEAEGRKECHPHARRAENASNATSGIGSMPYDWDIPQEEFHSAKARSHLKALSSEFRVTPRTADYHLPTAFRRLHVAASSETNKSRQSEDGRQAVPKTVQPIDLVSSTSTESCEECSYVEDRDDSEIPDSSDLCGPSVDCVGSSEMLRARLVASGSFGRQRPPSTANLRGAGDVDDAAAVAIMSGKMSSGLYHLMVIMSI